MELIAEIGRTDPELADGLMRLLNEIVLARTEQRDSGDNR